MTKVLCVESSARPDGLTATIARECLAGAAEAGAETEFAQLKDAKLEHCRMCDPEGWGLCREGRCVIEDGFAQLAAKIRAADGLVFATPVYYSDLSESMKTFLDRFRRCSGGQERRLKDKPTVIIAAAGGSGNGTTHCLFQLERALQVCGALVLDAIPAAKRNRDYKPEVARLAGRALGRKVAGK